MFECLASQSLRVELGHLCRIANNMLAVYQVGNQPEMNCGHSDELQ